MLRLAQIIERVPVRHVIFVPHELDQVLREYAAAYVETYGSAKPVAELIPAMLAGFIESDRAFARWKRAQN